MPAAGIYRMGYVLMSIVRPAPGSWERAGSLSTDPSNCGCPSVTRWCSVSQPWNGRRGPLAVGYYRLSGYWYPYRQINQAALAG